MSWINELFQTYVRCYGANLPGDARLMPICHTKQNAQIEVTIDSDGNFRRASIIHTDNATLIPCTEESASREGSRPSSHPLCDKLQYLAGDFAEFGGEVTSGFSKTPLQPFTDYCEGLQEWVDSEFAHPMAKAILIYVKKNQLISDLVAAKIIPIDDETGHQMATWNGEKVDAPEIFKALPNGYSPLDAFIRWNVEMEDVPEPSTSKSGSLIQSWIDFYTSHAKGKTGTCFVGGEDTTLAEKHPSKIRHAGDKAKLVSSNDNSGFTFRGRFTDSEQAIGFSFDVSQKAHNALRWLIERQAYRNGDLVFVAWMPEGNAIPDPFCDSSALLQNSGNDDLSSLALPHHDHNAGQHFANQLNKALAGFKTELNPNEHVVVIGLNSATTGRLSQILYRKIPGSEFIERVKTWHLNFAWDQNYSKKLKFVGAPSPSDIAEAAYGLKLDEKLKQATIQRIVPCIIEGTPFPSDLVMTCVNRMSHRMSMDQWEWNKYLGITCAIFKGYSLLKNKEYSMVLEPANSSRDYLYGRLLAIGEHIESRALFISGENRDTNAARQLQRFADFPYSTWKTIELAITPYKSRLRAQRAGLLNQLEAEIDDIMDLFSSDDFKSDRRLSGEFLLGYHCQRKKLWANPEPQEFNTKEKLTSS